MELPLIAATAIKGGSCTRGRGPSYLETRHTRRYPAHSHHYIKRQAPKRSGLGRWIMHQVDLTGRDSPITEFAVTDKG